MGEAVMHKRIFGRTGRSVGEVGFGAWAIGGSWGEVEESEALAALNAALDAGVTFIDTADVYGDGRSERLVAKALKARPGAGVFVATKAGRRLPQQTVAGYTYENLSGWIDRSLKNLEVETLDLVQLHCPPTDLYYHPEAFDALDRIKTAGKIRDYGVSVERIEEALKAIEYPGVVSVQIIFNIFRQRPAGLFFDAAKARNVAIIPRVPLASGLLTGKLKAEFDLRGRRPSKVQPSRRGLRRRRDLLGRALRGGLEGGRAHPPAGPGRCDHGATRAALDPDVRCGDRRHPGREDRDAGARQR